MLPLHLAARAVSFTQSVFPPLAMGFFGLATGYLIYGPQELFGFPISGSVSADPTIHPSRACRGRSCVLRLGELGGS